MAIQVGKDEEQELLAALYLQLMQKQSVDRSTGENVALNAEELEKDWRKWVTVLFPDYTRHPFGTRHEQLWQWAWDIQERQRPQPFVAVWPRGGAKSTSAELVTVSVAARKKRNYGLYICDTQDQADDHVGNIASLLESSRFAIAYPQAADRKISKYGHVKSWRRNRLWTASGFVIDAIGLDTAARGAKIEAERPDWMIFDDLDDQSDSPGITARNIGALTRKVLPAGSNDVAVLAVQNLVHPDSIFSMLVDGRADFLADRIVSGPFPAITDLQYEHRMVDNRSRYMITGGEATWLGQDLDACQFMIDNEGITAFLQECQHEVEAPPGGMYNHLDFDSLRVNWNQVPALTKIVVWVDPAVTDTDESDCHGIIASGIDAEGIVYQLWSWEARTSPQDSLRRAIHKAVELGAREVGVETDQGGETWDSVYREQVRELVAAGSIKAEEAPRFTWAKAGAGRGSKVERSSRMLADYERGQIRHVSGTHVILEKALKRFPNKPMDLVDAAYWGWDYLRNSPSYLSAPVGVSYRPSYWRSSPG